MRRAVLSLVIIIWLLLGLASSATSPELEQYQRFIDQQQQLLRQQQNQIERISRPAQARLNALKRNIVTTTEYLEDNEKKLAEIRTSLREMTQRQANLEAVFDRTRNRVIARLRLLQRQPTAYWWIAWLSSKDLPQFIDRRHQLQKLYQRDRQLLTDLKRSANSVLAQRDRVVNAQNEALLIQQQLDYQKANYESEAEVQQVILNRLQTDRRSLEVAEERLAQDSAQISQLIRSRAQTIDGVPLPAGTGVLQLPTQGVVTSTFGWRTHPILGYEKFHAGIDFGADYGTIIYAAYGGTVLLAGWYGGYGNAVIIDHGNGNSTLYGHTETLYVQEGQIVTKGQPIATVGSTGFSTGPHLHFELRVNGEPIDPAPYL